MGSTKHALPHDTLLFALAIAGVFGNALRSFIIVKKALASSELVDHALATRAHTSASLSSPGWANLVLITASLGTSFIINHDLP